MKSSGLKFGVLAAFALLASFSPVGAAQAQETETAIVAGGCFWCVESDFDHVNGVLETISGYTGGTLDNPTYKQVTAGGTGHYEAVKITFDPNVVSYEELLVAFWHSVDPTDAGGQFCDRGDSYRTAVFATEKQKPIALASKDEAERELGKPIATQILDASAFYPAEDYHQDYYMKNPVRYNFYRFSCGRNKRVDSVWGDKSYMGIDH